MRQTSSKIWRRSSRERRSDVGVTVGSDDVGVGMGDGIGIVVAGGAVGAFVSVISASREGVAGNGAVTAGAGAMPHPVSVATPISAPNRIRFFLRAIRATAAQKLIVRVCAYSKKPGACVTESPRTQLAAPDLPPGRQCGRLHHHFRS